MLVYALASACAAASSSFTMLLVCRAVQGLSAGTGVVVGRAVVRDTLEGPAAQKLMSRVVMIFAVAPAIAPIVGGQMLGLGGWHGMFWALTGFALLLATAVLLWLEESHPLSRRIAFAPGTLLASYVGFGRDRPFWPLLISTTVNFAGLFAYIASAPRIVRELLQLSAQGFPWLFVPIVTGMVGGAWLSGRLAGRHGVGLTLGVGYATMLLACLLHLLLAWLLPRPMLPWSILPFVLHGVGVQLAFPTLTLLLLERFPRQRGGASSVQAFVSLSFNALLAGVFAPWLSDSMLKLAWWALAMTLAGWLSWLWYGRLTRHAADHARVRPDADVEAQAEIAEPR
jgi:MFS transporter, DHA1 family, multidrug resistance protein